MPSAGNTYPEIRTAFEWCFGTAVIAYALGLILMFGLTADTETAQAAITNTKLREVLGARWPPQSRLVLEPTEAKMHGKFLFGGEGVTIPGTGVGFSFALFKLWLKPTGLPFRGYTTGSNQGLLGFAIVESSIVEFTTTDLEDEEPFFDLHASTVDVSIAPSLFIQNGGIATIKVTKLTNDGLPARSIGFTSDECRGIAATAGAISFRATLFALPEAEHDPTGQVFLTF